MQRIPATTDETVPEGSKPVCESLKKSMGKVINIFATTATSPAAINAMMGIKGAMKKASLSALEQEAVALLVGEMHGCVYCRAAHTAVAKMHGASVDDTLAWRRGTADNPRTQAILTMARAVVEKRGQLADGDIQAARDAGLTDAELIEVVTSVVENTFTNYVNALYQTDVDFPPAPDLG